MQNNLYLVFDANEEVYCVHFTMVVKIAALKEKYEGGLHKFMERHAARCNRELVVLVAMSAAYLSDATEDLKEAGFVHGEDFALFDASYYLLSPKKQFDLSFSWLKAYPYRNGVNVSYIDSVET